MEKSSRFWAPAFFTSSAGREPCLSQLPKFKQKIAPYLRPPNKMPKFPWPSAKMSHTGSSGAANAVRRSTSASSSGACRTFGRKVSGPRSTRSARVVSTLCFTQACGPRRYFGRFTTTFIPKLRVWARRRVIEALVEPVRHRAAQVVPAVAALIAARKELR